jgi:hypothetical protein
VLRLFYRLTSSVCDVAMQAGTYLMLSAFVSVDARYDVDSVGIRKLIGWDTTVLKTSAAVHKLPDNRCDDFYRCWWSILWIHFARAAFSSNPPTNVHAFILLCYFQTHFSPQWIFREQVY